MNSGGACPTTPDPNSPQADVLGGPLDGLVVGRAEGSQFPYCFARRANAPGYVHDYLLVLEEKAAGEKPKPKRPIRYRYAGMQRLEPPP